MVVSSGPGAIDGVMDAKRPELNLQNVLANSASPYLRGHKNNPVAWQEWTSETLALAKSHQRLIFLSIGYSACHWCHVMERESFCSSEVAAILNSSFIPIKLDRESRPDLDEIYMSYVTATTGSGGWPLNVFLTPDLQPVFGGTYWPGPASTTTLQRHAPSDETPMTFLDILHRMKDIWANQRDRCIQSASDITTQLLAFAAEGTHSHSNTYARGTDSDATDPPEPLDLDLLDDALDHFTQRFDSEFGGFTSDLTSPKFPTPCNLTFLLRIGASITHPSTHTRFGFPTPVPGILGKESCVTAASMALHTLLTMSRSGLRDHLGHGFHRYSVTTDWNLPHFEKMLYDNAQLLGCYCDAWALGRDPEILGTIYSLVEYFTSPQSPIVRPGGGWYASEDADSHPGTSASLPDAGHNEKKEGAFYVWTLKEFETLLGDRDANILARHFGAKSDGNVPAEYDMNDELLTQNVLHIDATPSVLAREFGLPEDEIVKIIKSGRAKLAEHRNTKRERPDLDDKVIASWNGLAISALARAANTLATIDKSRANRCREAAENALAFILREMYDESTGQLTRIYTPPQSQTPTGEDKTNTAFLDDYAYLGLACLALYDLTFHATYLQTAVRLQEYLDEHFIATTTGAYFQSARSPEQIMRLKPGTDNALPSANGLVAVNLMYLSSYLQDRKDEYLDKAQRVLDAFAVEVIQYPFLYVTLLSVVVMDQVGMKTLIAPQNMRGSEVRKLKGFGRTVVRGGDDVEKVMICTKEKVCRELRDGELEDDDESEERDDAFVKAAAEAAREKELESTR